MVKTTQVKVGVMPQVMDSSAVSYLISKVILVLNLLIQDLCSRLVKLHLNRDFRLGLRITILQKDVKLSLLTSPRLTRFQCTSSMRHRITIARTQKELRRCHKKSPHLRKNGSLIHMVTWISWHLTESKGKNSLSTFRKL